ncbi:MAG: YraN family protein [Clostridia bacterium]|nr:YraN family protein [Clostridia bacterium]
MNTKIKGLYGEDLAIKYLAKRKYKIISRNYTCPMGEIDIVALDKKTLVFIEVKARSNEAFGLPREAVNKPKQWHISKTAQYFIHEHQVFSLETRFDVIEILNEKINHIKNAFETNLL